MAVAEGLWLRAAESGEPLAAVGLGRLLIDRGDTSGGRLWLTPVAESGDGDGAFYLGQLYEREGDLKAARHWYRRSAEAGHRASAVVLGTLLAADRADDADDFGRSGPAQHWWSRGTAGLDAESARELGILLGWDTEVVNAEYDVRKQYEAGDPIAGYWLGRVLEERGGGLEWGSWHERAKSQFESVMSATMSASDVLDKEIWRGYKAFERGREVVPNGLDSPDVCAHIYACAWLNKWDFHYLSRGVSVSIREFFIPWFKAQSENGEAEATFLLGRMMLASAKADFHRAKEAEGWLRRAADVDEHGQAAFDLAIIRSKVDDHDGATYWYRQAAEMGHPAGAYELAKAVRSTDPATAERLCHQAMRAGHLPAAALLRVLRRKPVGITRPKTRKTRRDTSSKRRGKSATTNSSDGRVTELLALWDEVSGLAPEPSRCVDYLSESSGLPRDHVVRLRSIRNQCAHPAKRGMPNAYDIDLALTTARELRRRLAR